ncbi:alpha/beta hydrolase [Frisingicoccus sp.]|uniref:alpha/beta hydrolase n=1 Tax=Frisingicoccus sp. TaxID=1918627 RepID=UPI003AB4D49A
MTQEEIVKKRQELVHHMFSSTGDEFVRLVLENCRGGGSALTEEMRQRMNGEEFDYKGFPWYKFHVGEPKGKTRKILYFHGGGWVMNSGVAQFAFAEYLARETGAEIWFPEYPIVPEHNGEEALEMGMALYRQMLKECPGDAIAMGGDSAGGGLAVSVAMQIREEGLGQPNNLFLISPGCNVGGSPRNAEEKAYEDMLLERDAIVSTKGFPTVLDLWKGSTDKDDWRVNPMKGQLKGLPPMLVFAGGHEAMEMGIRQFVEEAIRQDADVVYYVRNGVAHAYVMFYEWAKEERKLIIDRLL